MPEGFLFDTVTCSRWRRGDRILRRRIEVLPVDAALFSAVMNIGELTFGIHHAPYEYQERLWQVPDLTHVSCRHGSRLPRVSPRRAHAQRALWQPRIGAARSSGASQELSDPCERFGLRRTAAR
jgi:hypothetical protein